MFKLWSRRATPDDIVSPHFIAKKGDAYPDIVKKAIVDGFPGTEERSAHTYRLLKDEALIKGVGDAYPAILETAFNAWAEDAEAIGPRKWDIVKVSNSVKNALQDSDIVAAAGDSFAARMAQGIAIHETLLNKAVKGETLEDVAATMAFLASQANPAKTDKRANSEKAIDAIYRRRNDFEENSGNYFVLDIALCIGAARNVTVLDEEFLRARDLFTTGKSGDALDNRRRVVKAFYENGTDAVKKKIADEVTDDLQKRSKIFDDLLDNITSMDSETDQKILDDIKDMVTVRRLAVALQAPLVK